jgi:hypothetical protein
LIEAILDDLFRYFSGKGYFFSSRGLSRLRKKNCTSPRLITPDHSTLAQPAASSQHQTSIALGVVRIIRLESSYGSSTHDA